MFFVVRGIIQFAYLLFFLVFFKFVLLYKEKKTILISLIFLLSITQLFVISINNFAQILEMLFFIGIIFLIYKKNFFPATILFGLTFYTHFITPFLFGIFLIFGAFFDKSEKKLYLKIFFGGLLIGVFWIFRYLVFFDWIQPNLTMDEHITFLSWFWRFGVEGFSFFILTLFLIFFFILNKSLIKSFFSKRLNKILLLYVIAFLPGFFYPERAIAYICFPIIVFCAQIFVKHFKESLLPAMLSVFVAVLSLYLFIQNPTGLVFYYVSGASIFIFLFALFLAVFFILITLNFYQKICSKVFFVLFVVFLFFNPAVYGVVLPFQSVLQPLDVTLQIPEEANNACLWVAKNYPGAIIASNDNRISVLCIRHGLKTTNYVVMEFAKKANNYSHEDYITHFIGYEDLNKCERLVWKEGLIFIYDYNYNFKD